MALYSLVSDFVSRGTQCTLRPLDTLGPKLVKRVVFLLTFLNLGDFLFLEREGFRCDDDDPVRYDFGKLKGREVHILQM